MAKEVLSVEHLHKQFGRKEVLKGISFKVKKREILGIIGVSGAGKTVLLKTIVNFYLPSCGEILFKDNPITRMNAKRIFGVSVQESSFYPELTVRENIYHFGRLYKMHDSEIEKRMHELLHILELHGCENKLASQLSGGMQKRLDIACAMIHKPELLLLDEPTTGLDILLKRDLLRLIKGISARGVTVIVVSLPLEIESICDKLLLIDEGAIVKKNLSQKIKEIYGENPTEIIKKFSIK